MEMNKVTVKTKMSKDLFSVLDKVNEVKPLEFISSIVEISDNYTSLSQDERNYYIKTHIALCKNGITSEIIKTLETLLKVNENKEPYKSILKGLK